MGVSGGYQAARRGPSLCPGGEEQALDIVMPLLRQVAAKDSQGNPCVAKAGTGGAGHYVKMIHNGIEHGMMSALAEAWQIMNIGLRMSYDDIADVFAHWNGDGELVSQLISFQFPLHNFAKFGRASRLLTVKKQPQKHIDVHVGQKEKSFVL